MLLYKNWPSNLAQHGPFHAGETEESAGRFDLTVEQKAELSQLAKTVESYLKQEQETTMTSAQDKLDEIKSVIKTMYPDGLPAEDPINAFLESPEKVVPEDHELWWASKHLQEDKLLFDYTGRNEKTKIIVKLQKAGTGPPVKENPLDEQGQKNMLAFYYKKQEEEKRLAANQDLDHIRSTWADNTSMKRTFQGLSDVSWRPR